MWGGGGEGGRGVMCVCGICVTHSPASHPNSKHWFMASMPESEAWSVPPVMIFVRRSQLFVNLPIKNCHYDRYCSHSDGTVAIVVGRETCLHHRLLFIMQVPHHIEDWRSRSDGPGNTLSVANNMNCRSPYSDCRIHNLKRIFVSTWVDTLNL